MLPPSFALKLAFIVRKPNRCNTITDEVCDGADLRLETSVLLKSKASPPKDIT